MSESPVTYFDAGDPAMLSACEQARDTFRYFWREVSWDYRRIIPALDFAYVKFPFVDETKAKTKRNANPHVEQMWVSELEFDGEFIHGVLMNSPNKLKSIKQGDTVRRPLAKLSDWMFAISEKVYGAFTVNLLRSRMKKKEREQHDDMWGLDFGDPAKPRRVSEREQQKTCEAFAESLREHIAKDKSLLTATDDRSWTLLHNEALVGNLATVNVLLAAGAKRTAVTNRGKTPQQLAQSMGWDEVAAVLAVPSES